MSILESIKSTLTADLGILESDAEQLGKQAIAAGKQDFATILESVLQKVKSKPIGEILSGVYQIYKQVHAQAGSSASPSA
jgi:hypothetical protein